MHRYKLKVISLAANTKELFVGFGRGVGSFYTKNRILLGTITNLVTIAAFTFGVIALIALIWLQVRPIKVADIKLLVL